jgi:hypothetical protein
MKLLPLALDVGSETVELNAYVNIAEIEGNVLEKSNAWIAGIT